MDLRLRCLINYTTNTNIVYSVLDTDHINIFIITLCKLLYLCEIVFFEGERLKKTGDSPIYKKTTCKNSFDTSARAYSIQSD